MVQSILESSLFIGSARQMSMACGLEARVPFVMSELPIISVIFPRNSNDLIVWTEDF